MRFVIAGPLDSPQLFQAAVAHASVHGTELAYLVPDTFRVWCTPIMAEAASQIVNDLQIVANPRRRRHGAAYPLHAALAGSDRSFTFEGTGSGRQNHIGQFGGLGIEEVLDYEEFKSTPQLERADAVRFKVRGIFTQNIKPH